MQTCSHRVESRHPACDCRQRSCHRVASCRRPNRCRRSARPGENGRPRERRLRRPYCWRAPDRKRCLSDRRRARRHPPRLQMLLQFIELCHTRYHRGTAAHPAGVFIEKSCDRKNLISNDFIVSVVIASVARTSKAISLLAWSPACRKRRAGITGAERRKNPKGAALPASIRIKLTRNQLPMRSPWLTIAPTAS
jgi:hypothetical protein